MKAPAKKKKTKKGISLLPVMILLLFMSLFQFIDRYGHNYDNPGNDKLPHGINIHHSKSVLNYRDYQNSNKRAEHGTYASGEAYPAQDRCRHYLELKTQTGRVICRAQP